MLNINQQHGSLPVPRKWVKINGMQQDSCLFGFVPPLQHLHLFLWEKYFGRKFLTFILFWIANGRKDKCCNNALVSLIGLILQVRNTLN